VLLAAGFSLYAVAAAESTTFLALTVGVTLAFQLATAIFFGFVSAFPELVASQAEINAAKDKSDTTREPSA